jgi:2-amino-4-hydroxy-6-hydroxymethyldihydropteridine diphosphokinase
MEAKPILRGNPRQTRAYIGLGSNQGDRLGFVQQAMQLLKDIPRIRVIECSSLYETQPLNDQVSEWFVNAVAAIETSLGAEELLDVCKDIEKRLISLSRRQTNPTSKKIFQERVIDLDILFFGDKVVESEHLKIPHPMVDKKAYALVPLLEIAPELRHPRRKKTVAQLHEELPEPELIYLYGTRQEEES